jgi:hypothetical protein
MCEPLMPAQEGRLGASARGTAAAAARPAASANLHQTRRDVWRGRKRPSCCHVTAPVKGRSTISSQIGQYNRNCLGIDTNRRWRRGLSLTQMMSPT